MAPRRLSSAAKRQSGSNAKKAATNLAKGNKKDTTKSSTPATPATKPTTQTSSTALATDVQVPGLVTIAPDGVAGMMPTFKHESYAISDPLNPPSTIPQATVEQHRKGMLIYEGGIRALDLTGAAFDLTAKRFTVVGKQAKAFGAGVQAATEFEKVKGNYTDYLNQLEVNSQKGIALDLNQTKTTSERTQSGYRKEEINQKEEQARLASEKAKLDTQKKQAEFDGLKAELGALPAAS
jgi:hypothetical protein